MNFSDVFKSSFLESITEFSAIDTLIAMIFALVIGMFIYLICVQKMHVINTNEYADLPMGKRIERLGKKLHLL